MPLEMESPLRVLFITAEADPFVKIGGLGDYGGSLPKALSDLNSPDAPTIDIRVVLPFHAGIKEHVPNLTKITNFNVPTRKGYAKGQIFQFAFHDIIYYLIKRSGNPSGYKNVYNPTPLEDARKYIFFSSACLEILKIIDWVPDLIHANDWHTAISASD